MQTLSPNTGPFAVVMMWALLLAGCFSVDSPTEKGERLQRRNEGYSLLHRLVTREAGVDKILALKHAQPEISEEIKAIAHTFDQSRKQLDAYIQDKSTQIIIIESPLPTI